MQTSHVRRIPRWLATLLIGLAGAALGGIVTVLISEHACQFGVACERKVEIQVLEPIYDVKFVQAQDYERRASKDCKSQETGAIVKPDTFGAELPFHLEAKGYKGTQISVAGAYRLDRTVQSFEDSSADSPKPISFSPRTLGEPGTCYIWMRYPSLVGLPGTRIFARLEVHDSDGGLLQFDERELELRPIKLFRADNRGDNEVDPERIYNRYSVPKSWFIESTSSVVIINENAWVPLRPFADIMGWKVELMQCRNSNCDATILAGGKLVKVAVKQVPVADRFIGFAGLKDLCDHTSGWHLIFGTYTREIHINLQNGRCKKEDWPKDLPVGYLR